MDTLDVRRRRLAGRRTTVVLTPAELAVLTALRRGPHGGDAPLRTIEDIGRALWGPRVLWPIEWRNGALNAICRTRGKMRAADTAAAIETRLGRGYELTAPIETVNEGEPVGGTNGDAVTETAP